MTSERITRAAATRRTKTARYTGPLFRMLVGVEVKAPNASEAERRMETLLAELITGAPIDASDMWVQNAAIYSTTNKG